MNYGSKCQKDSVTGRKEEIIFIETLQIPVYSKSISANFYLWHIESDGEHTFLVFSYRESKQRLFNQAIQWYNTK